jgi:hypothetical protein
VRKVVAIFFLILAVSTTDTAIQVFKLPILLTHFRDHVSDGRSHSISDFIKEHYSGSHQNDADSKQDEQLPFKTLNSNAFFCVYLPSAPITTVQSSIALNNKKILYAGHFTLQDHMARIYQPPKAA